MKLVRSVEDVDFEIDDLPATKAPDRVLMADPRDFEVAYAINPHMRDAQGRLQEVDRAAARRQWEELRRALEALGLVVDVVPALEGHPDLVFCANQVLPIPRAAQDASAPCFVPSHMAHPERAGEVPLITRALEERGYRRAPLASDARLEGTGDGLGHPSRRLLWAGVGPRSSEAAWAEVAERHDLTVVLLPLSDEHFYHLDTCLCLLDAATCLWFPEALTPAARALVERLVPRRITVPAEDARLRLAANALCPDGHHVLLQRGSPGTERALTEAGFEVVPLATEEFLKAGGSVFCMKLLYGPI